MADVKVESDRGNSRYCCEDKCFEIPSNQVDGLACFECGYFSYCGCRCRKTRESGKKLIICRTDIPNVLQVFCKYLPFGVKRTDNMRTLKLRDPVDMKTAYSKLRDHRRDYLSKHHYNITVEELITLFPVVDSE